MRQLSADERSTLSKALTKETPLGPIGAEKLSDATSLLLFSPENDITADIHPCNLLIGRRGAGKTSFLNYLRLNSVHRTVVLLEAQNIFPETLKLIQRIFSQEDVNPETTATLWEVLIWSAVFSVLTWGERENSIYVVPLASYLSRFGLRRGMGADQVIHHIVKFLASQQKAGGPIDTPLQLQAALRFNNASYEQARDAALKLLRARQGSSSETAAIVLMDTLENFNLQVSAVRSSFAGLLKFVGRQQPSSTVLDIHFCIPAEIFPTLLDSSSNSLKDFESHTFLHWRAGDLVQIAARRLLLYLQLYDKPKYEAYAARYQVERRSDAIAFWLNILPPLVQNRLGVQEPSLAHILRHTQLLPRHVLLILNAIIRQAIDSSGALGSIDGRWVTQNVASIEHLLRNDLAAAYKTYIRRRWNYVSESSRIYHGAFTMVRCISALITMAADY